MINSGGDRVYFAPDACISGPHGPQHSSAMLPGGGPPIAPQYTEKPTAGLKRYASYIKISSGLGDLKDKIIRIGHMCPSMSEADIQEVLEGLAAFKK